MCHCLSFLLELHPVCRAAAASSGSEASPSDSLLSVWIARSLRLLSRGLDSWSRSLNVHELHDDEYDHIKQQQLEYDNVLVQKEQHSVVNPEKVEDDDRNIDIQLTVCHRTLGNICPLRRIHANAGNDIVCLFTEQGQKGVNQDSMLVWQDFIQSEDVGFYGVFDGHGSEGHYISRMVRDKLPAKLLSCWRTAHLSYLMARRHDSPEDRLSPKGNGNSLSADLNLISMWEESFHTAYRLMDREIWANEDIDSIYSGSTALTIVKQGKDLIIANLGDSRAVLGVKFNDTMLPLQLTVDLTPNVPREAERIRRCRGRVLALRDEPYVKRVWLPNENRPGLAMARAFGDYLVKNHGVISVPEVTHRRISKNDKFVVAATDGIWNVLSNEQVVHIVDSTPDRSLAARAVTEAATKAWKHKFPDSKADDCAVICLFLD